MEEKRISQLRYDFNSRPYARGDPIESLIEASNEFQFTPLREGRLPQSLLSPGGSYFNSRPYARGDSATSQSKRGVKYFNSRPYARGDSLLPHCTTSS